uniref:Uncharacterized protein n=1 Tax=Arundo donax TaxID=35708 RepID=A0A0A9H145_ARUDO
MVQASPATPIYLTKRPQIQGTRWNPKNTVVSDVCAA